MQADRAKRPRRAGPPNDPKKLRAAVVLLLCLAALVFSISLGVRLFSSAGGKNAAPEVQETVLPSARGTNIHATVTLPGTAEGAGLVVYCHGFTGNRRGDGHYAPLAAALAEGGVASIAIDFAGSGESEEPFTAYTLESMYDDIDSAVSYMQTTYGTDAARVGLVGHSMGGRAVALHLSESIAAAALWSPATGDGLDGLEFIDHDAAGREAFRAAAAETGSYAVPGWNIAISSDFIEQMAASHPLDNIRAYQAPLLIAYAGGDPDLLSQNTIDTTMQAAGERGTPFTDLSAEFAGATHNYAAISGDTAESAQISEKLESTTAEFFLTALAAK